MSTIQEQIAALQGQLDKLRTEVAATAEPKKLPYNAWYKGKYRAIVYFTGEGTGYGLNGDGEWGNHTGWIDLNSGRWSPCPHSEVEDMMIKEAEKRGFVKGVRYKCVLAGTKEELKKEFKLYPGTANQLTDGWGGSVFYNGQWAEIIKDDVIEIGGYEVYFAVNGGIAVNGKEYTPTQVEAARAVLQFGGKIMVGCSHQYELTLETVEKILAKL